MDLFHKGIRPAVNVGKSVSRVGGSAQIKAMKKVAGTIKLELAQFRELEAFAAFASDLDKASQAQLARGRRLVEALKQPQYQPYRVEQQVALFFVATKGYLDEVAEEDVQNYEKEFLEFIEQKHRSVYDLILKHKSLKDEVVSQLKSAAQEFQAIFTPSAERSTQ